MRPGCPPILTSNPQLAFLGVMLLMIGGMMIIPMVAAGKSPHTMLRPSDSTIRLADVVGAEGTRREAIDTLNLFLNHETFSEEMGGTPRRGVLFEGAPGTGKTYLAKASAAEAEVPFLFVSASEFQSHFYGMTNRKIRQFFKALRGAARAEGGAIGFIEEFVTIADRTAGYSPVRIEKLLDEALIIALRSGRKSMNIEDLVEAQLITEVGLAQDVGYQPEERRRIAVHEAGHAVAAVLVGRDVRVASILRRSSSLGLVAHDDAEERHLRTPSELHDLIVVALAGRAAEIQEYGEASTGIASDLAAATGIAAQLIGTVGAGESLLSLEAAQMHMAGNMAAKVLADERSRAQADEIMNKAADKSACMLLEHRVALLAVADALCQHDELTGDLVHEIVAEAVSTGG